jgi:ribonuclease HI
MVEIYTDGASRGNPGRSAFSGVIVKKRQIVKIYSELLGISTNNVAEYSAIIKALEEGYLLKESKVTIFSDSELAISQINGLYKVKAPHLVGLLRVVQQKRSLFESVNFEHVSRENNYTRIADKLCSFILGPK